jgi:hypothetical protein
MKYSTACQTRDRISTMMLDCAMRSALASLSVATGDEDRSPDWLQAARNNAAEAAQNILYVMQGYFAGWTGRRL